jgi:uncharacterized damage-inducible protein DinB
VGQPTVDRFDYGGSGVHRDHRDSGDQGDQFDKNLTEHSSTYGFLLETYGTEILKILTIWGALEGVDPNFRPAPKARSVLEQMEHQVQSEGRWMASMLEADTGDPNPTNKTAAGYIEKYNADAQRRLTMLASRPDEWWRATASFFDVTRSHAWIMTRRMTHSSHHRGQLIVYLRLLGIPVPSVYGPTADTDGVVKYKL